MGKLQPFVDMTGKMSQSEINKANITNIVDELNRNADQLDAISSNFRIVARGSVVLTSNGTQFTGGTVPLATGTISTFLAYVVRSDQPNNLNQLLYSSYDSSYNFQFSVWATISGGALSVTTLLASGYTPPAGMTLTVYYYIFQQPAGVTS